MKKRIYLSMQASARSLNYLLGWLIAGTRGGVNRARIIETLRQSSLNTNQLAEALKISYKTAKTQLESLEKNRIVTSSYVRGQTIYALSNAMQENYPVFEKLLKKINERPNKQRIQSEPKLKNLCIRR